MILRKFIGWCIIFGSFLVGLRGLELSAHGAEVLTLSQSRNASAQLTLQHWPENGWLVQRFERKVEIRFPKLGKTIKADSAFYGALAERVSSIESDVRDDDAYLFLTLVCDCSIAVTGQAGSTVTVDVVDPNPKARTSPAPKRAPLPIWKDDKSSLQTTEPSVSKPGEPLDVDQARQRLMEQLLKAADAGLVDLKPDPKADRSQAEDKAVPPAATDETPSPEPIPAEEETREQQSASREDESAVMQGSTVPSARRKNPKETETFAEVETMPAQPVVPPQCFADEAFILPDLTGENSFSEKLADVKADLLGEFDNANAEAAIDLVRLYLAAALSPEARMVMNDFIPDHPLTPLYREMADLLESKPLPGTASLQLAECGGDQRLWRALARAVDGDGQSAARDEEAADRALERLPSSLRGHVGAKIGLAAANAGAWDSARRMEAMIDRSVGAAYGKTGLELLLSARLAEWHGNPDKARDMLKQARVRAGLASEQAVLLMAETGLGDAALGLNTNGLRQDLGALARVARGTTTGWRAFELEVQFLDLAEGRDAAIDLLSHGVETGLYPDDAFASLVTRLVEGSLYNEMSRPLALIYIDELDRYVEALNQQGFRRALIQSLIDEGLPGMASSLVRNDDFNEAPMIEELVSALFAGGALSDIRSLLSRMPEGAARDRFGARLLIAEGQPNLAEDRLASAAKDWMASDASQLEVLDIEIAAALAGNDIQSALNAIAMRLELSPDAKIAERAALLALEAGVAPIPSEARGVLAAQEPETLQRLELLFRSAELDSEIPDAASATAMIKTLESEISLIEDILNDG